MREQNSIHIDDTEIEALTLQHYGRAYRPGHMDIGGDESGGMYEVDATGDELVLDEYDIKDIERWKADGYDPETMLRAMICTLVLDGHLKPANYIVEGSWG